MDTSPAYSKITVVTQINNAGSHRKTNKEYIEPALEEYVCYRLKTIIGDLFKAYIEDMTVVHELAAFGFESRCTLSLEFTPKPGARWDHSSSIWIKVAYDEAYDGFVRKTLAELQESAPIALAQNKLQLKKKDLANLMVDIDDLERKIEEMKKSIGM
jgi:hypothetical protein